MCFKNIIILAHPYEKKTHQLFIIIKKILHDIKKEQEVKIIVIIKVIQQGTYYNNIDILYRVVSFKLHNNNMSRVL